jgi:hypothetical protein
MSYLDSMEIVGFLAKYPQFRPAPLRDLASVYYAAWRSLQRDYNTDRHLFNMSGRGASSYDYMTDERQWQQTTALLAKSAASLQLLAKALSAESVIAFPVKPQLPEVARFDFFRKGDRPAGAWLVRQGRLRFALPITTGKWSGSADYLPAPHALPGFDVPAEKRIPALVPYIELADGRVIVASDGADEIYPSQDGGSLRVVWKRWALVRKKSGEDAPSLHPGEAERLITPGLRTEVVWSIQGDSLIREERITASRLTTIRRFCALFPSTASRHSTRLEGGRRIDRFRGSDAELEVAAASPDMRLAASVEAAGSGLDKGTRGPIPLILRLHAADLAVQPGHPLRWTVRLRML